MPRPNVEAERKDQILQATCAVIAETGFRSLRVSDVANRAGLSTGIVHYYFDTKKALTKAAFEWNFSHSLDRRKSLLIEDSDPEKRLRRFLDSYLPSDAESIAAWRVWVELWVEAIDDPDLREVNERVYGSWRDEVAQMIRSGQADGAFRDGDPESLANGLIGLIDGLSLQVLMGSKDMGVEKMREVCEQALDRVLLDG